VRALNHAQHLAAGADLGLIVVLLVRHRLLIYVGVRVSQRRKQRQLRRGGRRTGSSRVAVLLRPLLRPLLRRAAVVPRRAAPRSAPRREPVRVTRVRCCARLPAAHVRRRRPSRPVQRRCVRAAVRTPRRAAAGGGRGRGLSRGQQRSAARAAMAGEQGRCAGCSRRAAAAAGRAAYLVYRSSAVPVGYCLPSLLCLSVCCWVTPLPDCVDLAREDDSPPGLQSRQRTASKMIEIRKVGE